MAITLDSSGSQLTVLDTEHDTGTPSAAGVYVFRLDVDAMVLGDRILVRPYIHDGTADELAGFPISIDHDYPGQMFVSPPVPMSNSAAGKFTIEQTDGTVRTYNWFVDKL